ncbi:hypothetical protein Sj15T_10340 [Sphingobium sp. TA15]|uniref:Uncharacterized protein n=1 Tax=Sphingobium indicum (strain DSM 16413 / CCM 7287 / MTCC 6362 / UT26 / NBRC 101211 / UT26S) TaxID=452662 RepID=D4Z8V5_SPHIU|nr:hypothetical protein [Sphingobium indicum]BAI99037.1 hypothetical protein SJA_P1-00850 [Sphingobium indicum UT26S]BDD66013.1 hypothetical protein Sj15T_10340 [Sphingobium sp. TA15]
MLRSIGRMDFAVAPGRSDGAKNGGDSNSRDPSWAPRGRTLASPPYGTAAEQEEILRIRNDDFH